jgi:NOL1/NOP2/sun family putative RNA methylase
MGFLDRFCIENGFVPARHINCPKTTEQMQPHTIPDADKYVFKKDFIERYSKLTDWEQFKIYSLSFIRKAIRINTLKISVDECTKRLKNKGWHTEQVPWCKEGFWIEHSDRRDVGNLWEHHMGYIYVQEAASMIPPIVLNPQPHESVLDISAAPGSKATQIVQLMKNTGVLVANDYKAIRLAALGVNVQRVGALNTIVTFMTGQGIRNHQFDRILVDAPCSGTGTIGKSLKTIKMWNPVMVQRLARQQTQLLDTAWNLLKTDGTLVYSTCTLEPEEDEGVISAFAKNHADASVDKIKDSELPGLKRSPAVTEFEGEKYAPEVKNCLRIWPQDNYTEGFFVARIKKI